MLLKASPRHELSSTASERHLLRRKILNRFSGMTLREDAAWFAQDLTRWIPDRNTWCSIADHVFEAEHSTIGCLFRGHIESVLQPIAGLPTTTGSFVFAPALYHRPRSYRASRQIYALQRTISHVGFELVLILDCRDPVPKPPRRLNKTQRQPSLTVESLFAP